jgi:hypothetical protein
LRAPCSIPCAVGLVLARSCGATRAGQS